MLPKLLSEETRRDRPEIAERVRQMILANSSDAIAAAIRGLMTRSDATPLLGTIHCPALILVGRDDGITPIPFSEQMHKAIAGSELVVVDHAGHLANLEQPAAFNGALGRFLDSRV
jgi:pimeloyl-ACP methyl ester carboxylesterase